MKSVIRIFGAPLSVITYPLRIDGEVDVCPVDAFAGQTFNINSFGDQNGFKSGVLESYQSAPQLLQLLQLHVKQFMPQFFLKLLYLFRQRGLRDMKPLGCPCHIFLSCDG